MNYLIWGHSPDPSLCVLNPPEGVPDAYQLNYGISRIGNFPLDALFRMNPEFKRAIKLSDALDNENFLIVASKRLKEFFERESVPNTEYLRVTIINHKNRISNDEYYIVHQVDTQDCINLERSIIDWNPINPEQLSSVDKLFIDETRIASDATLFRAKFLPPTIFIRKDLARKIEEAGFTGVRFREVDSFRKV
jgi:hypothetical protein